MMLLAMWSPAEGSMLVKTTFLPSNRRFSS